MAYPHDPTSRRALEFLANHPAGVLSTVTADGKPWGSTIYFATDEDFTIYFVTRSETLKFQNLEEQPTAALTVFDDAEQATVQMSGPVTKVPTDRYTEVFVHMFSQLRKHAERAWVPPIEKIHAGEFRALQIAPTLLQFAEYAPHESGEARDDVIKTLIPY